MSETNGKDGKTATKTAPPSPRSGYALPVGAHPGNTGGKKGRSGRPPSIIRQRCRAAFWRQLDVLEEIASGETLAKVRDATGRVTDMTASAEIAERLRAVDLLGKYGLGTTVTETDTEGNDAPRSVVIYLPGNGRSDR